MKRIRAEPVKRTYSARELYKLIREYKLAYFFETEPFPQKRTQNRMKQLNKNTKIRCTAITRLKRQVQIQSEQAKATRGQTGG